MGVAIGGVQGAGTRSAERTLAIVLFVATEASQTF